ncbi:hypothetical protein [Wolbachia endosymbiont of Dactylopius coccus]
MRYKSNLYQEERCHLSSLFLVIPVPRLLGSRKKNGVIRVAPFLSSQCPDYLDPGCSQAN